MDSRLLDATDRSVSLGEARRGYRGRVVCLLPTTGTGRLAPDEMERRLIEMGFIEGVEVSVIHEGPFGRDPIAVRVGAATVALRRRDAMAILTE
ncbi:iron transporter FeoA [Salipiger sp. CCB-MM3]|uniref:FeoA family protein n=1 Tax=Roseobacteraceae TaxID=2854170 RepID=UPI00080ABAB7|nr:MULTISPECIES: FeoA domain-containing protein [Roseobacteraceae]ANT60975.1 iron transporter FeoA [Salipiger sp. CCB-MM3]MCA0994193.1 FeoA domain-containing protein [Alloyangia pacifica]